MGIIVTPGTFNAANQPGVASGVYVFPKTPDSTINKWLQFSTRQHEQDELPSVACIYSYVEFVSGVSRVGVASADYDGSKNNFESNGIRYLPNADYSITAKDLALKRYTALQSPAPFIVTGSPRLDLGTVEALYNAGTFEMASNNVRIDVEYNIAILGTAESPPVTYALQVIGSTSPGANSGTIVAGSVYAPSPSSNGFATQIHNRNLTLTAQLRRAGSIFDKVTILIPYTLQVTFRAAGLGEPIVQPQVAAGMIFTDTLFGKSAGSPVGTVPAHPYSEYVRESFAEEGTLVLS